MSGYPISLEPKERVFVEQIIQEASASGVGIPWFSENSAVGKRLGLSEFLPVMMINGVSLEDNFRFRSNSPEEWFGSPKFAQDAAFMLELLSQDTLCDGDSSDGGFPCWLIAKQIWSVTGRPVFEEAVALGALAAGYILAASSDDDDDPFICYLSHLELYRAVFKLEPEVANA